MIAVIGMISIIVTNMILINIIIILATLATIAVRLRS